MTAPNVEFTHRNYAIASYLVHGHTPWGVELPKFNRAKGDQAPRLVLCEGIDEGEPHEWIMCCGHVLSRAEGEVWLVSGVADAGRPDKWGRPTMIAGPKVKDWLHDCWYALAGEYGPEVEEWNRQKAEAEPACV